MQLEWYGQSAFRLTDDGTTVFIDPFDDLSAMRDRGLRWDYPAIAGVRADLLLVTHEHLDHNGVGTGMFAAPNTSAIMSSVPASRRGVASGMRATFQNSGTVLSIGVFFSLIIAGLAGTLPTTLTHGLEQQGVPAGVAAHIGGLPPVSSLFAAFLGENPVQHLLGPTGALAAVTPAQHATLTGREFFPHLISGPFRDGLHAAFAFAMVACLIAAAASAMRGGRMAAAVLVAKEQHAA